MLAGSICGWGGGGGGHNFFSENTALFESEDQTCLTLMITI